MSLTRREFHRTLALAGLAGLIAEPAVAVDQPQDDAEKLLDAARKGNAAVTKARLELKLPEGSEPCFRFVPVAAPKRGKKR